MGTSPEPSLNSPTTKLDNYGLNTINEENLAQSAFGGEKTFCEKLKLACGDTTNPVPAVMTVSNGDVNPLGPAKTPGSDFNWLAEQNGGSFDPVLFGEYRDPQDAVVGQDFGTFFNDAFPLPDLGSPFNTFNNEIQSDPSPAPKNDLMKQVNTVQAAEEEVVPGEDTSKMLTCNKIWLVARAPSCDDSAHAFSGIACSRWRSSVTARLISTTSAASSARKPVVPKVARSSTRKTLSTFSEKRSNRIKEQWRTSLIG